MELLKEYVNLETLLACLLVGNIVKHSLPKITNQFIPLIVIGVGITSEVITKGATTQSVLIGAVTALVSVGGHQAIKQTLKEIKEFKVRL